MASPNRDEREMMHLQATHRTCSFDRGHKSPSFVPRQSLAWVAYCLIILSTAPARRVRAEALSAQVPESYTQSRERPNQLIKIGEHEEVIAVAQDFLRALAHLSPILGDGPPSPTDASPSFPDSSAGSPRTISQVFPHISQVSPGLSPASRHLSPVFQGVSQPHRRRREGGESGRRHRQTVGSPWSSARPASPGARRITPCRRLALQSAI